MHTHAYHTHRTEPNWAQTEQSWTIGLSWLKRLLHFLLDSHKRQCTHWGQIRDGRKKNFGILNMDLQTYQSGCVYDERWEWVPHKFERTIIYFAVVILSVYMLCAPMNVLIPNPFRTAESICERFTDDCCCFCFGICSAINVLNIFSMSSHLMCITNLMHDSRQGFS